MKMMREMSEKNLAPDISQTPDMSQKYFYKNPKNTPYITK